MELVIILFGIIFLALIIKTIINSNIPSWVKKKINSLVRVKIISSKQITGISPLLKDIEFSVDKPSLFGWALVIIMTIAIVFAVMCGIFIGLASVFALNQPIRPGSNPDFQGEIDFGGPSAKFFCLSILLVGAVWVFRALVKKIRSVLRYSRSTIPAVCDKRPPVLLLRSFAADVENNEDKFNQRTIEETIVKFVKNHGRVLTVNEPGLEGPPLLGANRIYLDDNWKESVTKLLKVSSLVILEADTTKGLLWELENVKSNMHPNRVIISFLSKQNAPDVQTEYLESSQTSFNKFYMNYSKYFNAIFGQALPDFDENTCFLIFDENWNPHPIQIKITKKKGLINRKRVKKRFNAVQIHNLFIHSIERVAKIESFEQ